MYYKMKKCLIFWSWLYPLENIFCRYKRAHKLSLKLDLYVNYTVFLESLYVISRLDSKPSLATSSLLRKITFFNVLYVYLFTRQRQKIWNFYRISTHISSILDIFLLLLLFSYSIISRRLGKALANLQFYFITV